MGPVEGPARVPDRRASLEVDRIEGTGVARSVGPPPPGRAPERTHAGEGELDRVAGALAPVKLFVLAGSGCRPPLSRRQI